MLAHLGENCADVQVDLTRVRYFQRLVHCHSVSGVEASVLEIKSLFKITQGVSQFIGLAKQTSVVVISYCS